MSEIRLFGLPDDPDTEVARDLFSRHHLSVEVIDVEKAGILPFLERDLDVRSLPFIVVDNTVYAGLSRIRSFVERLVPA